MTTYAETKRYARLHDRHPQKVSSRHWSLIHDLRIIKVPLDENRPVVPHARNRSGRTILVIRIFHMLVVAIVVTT